MSGTKSANELPAQTSASSSARRKSTVDGVFDSSEMDKKYVLEAEVIKVEFLRDAVKIGEEEMEVLIRKLKKLS